MRRTKLTLSTLLCAALTACAAGPTATTTTTPAQPSDLTCTGAPLLRPGDVAVVEPLWAANKLVKSPSYQLAGVLVELHPDATPTRQDLQTAIACRSACATGQPDPLALPGLRATLAPGDERIAVILRSDDPTTTREALRRAQQLRR